MSIHVQTSGSVAHHPNLNLNVSVHGASQQPVSASSSPTNANASASSSPPLYRRQSSVYQSSSSSSSSSSPALIESLKPFADRLPEEEEPRYVELEPSERPESLHPEIWARFLQKRRYQFDKDLELKRCQAQMVHMQRHYSHLQSMRQALEHEVASVAYQLGHLQVERQKQALNSEIMLKVKQGLVEVQDSPVLEDLKDSEMIERVCVERLNEHIQHLGREKVEILKEMTSSKSAISLLKWSHRKLDLEYKDAVDQTTELQLLRVTKSLQTVIKMGGRDQQKAAEIKKLDRTIDFLAQAQDEQTLEQRSALASLQRRIQATSRENTRLAQTVSQLTVAVQERQQIKDIGGPSITTDVRNDQKMKQIVTRRKLVDLAKVQSEELAYLRQQVESLRRRTFASFAIPPVVHNPDERARSPQAPSSNHSGSPPPALQYDPPPPSPSLSSSMSRGYQPSQLSHANPRARLPSASSAHASQANSRRRVESAAPVREDRLAQLEAAQSVSRPVTH